MHHISSYLEPEKLQNARERERERERESYKSAFTLVEISVVLVIIGLIIGGIVVGRDLIRSAEVRNYVAEIDRIKSAIAVFRLKYNCLPGDCLNATDIWGTYASCPTASTSPETNGTCNGNGDGRYSWGAEVNLATEHLSISGLYKSSKLVGGVNKYLYMSFHPIENPTYDGSYLYTNDIYSTISTSKGNTLNLAQYNSGCVNGVIFPATQSQQVDAKADDGIASKGKFYGLDGKEPTTGVGCTGAAVTCRSGTDYDLINATSSNPRCRMVIFLDN